MLQTISTFSSLAAPTRTTLSVAQIGASRWEGDKLFYLLQFRSVNTRVWKLTAWMQWMGRWMACEKATTNCFRPRHEKFHLNQYARHSARKNGFMKAEIKIKHFCLLSRERVERKILNKIMPWRWAGEGEWDGINRGVGRHKRGRAERTMLTFDPQRKLITDGFTFAV